MRASWLEGGRGRVTFREEFVDAYAYAFANGWDPNGKNLSMLMRMLLLMVGIPSASSDVCVGGCR